MCFVSRYTEKRTNQETRIVHLLLVVLLKGIKKIQNKMYIFEL